MVVKHQPWKGVYPEELITEETDIPVETLSCNNCGGMIELPNTTNYVTALVVARISLCGGWRLPVIRRSLETLMLCSMRRIQKLNWVG